VYNSSVSYLPKSASNYRWYKEKNKYTIVGCDLFLFLKLSMYIGDKQKLLYLIAG